MNMWRSALPRAPFPPVPPYLDIQLIVELHRLEEVAGDDPFLQGEERRVVIAWQEGNSLLEDTTARVLPLPCIQEGS